MYRIQIVCKYNSVVKNCNMKYVISKDQVQRNLSFLEEVFHLFRIPKEKSTFALMLLKTRKPQYFVKCWDGNMEDHWQPLHKKTNREPRGKFPVRGRNTIFWTVNRWTQVSHMRTAAQIVALHTLVKTGLIIIERQYAFRQNKMENDNTFI